MTANQVVAYNLRRAREERGATQEETAQRLEQYLGKRWSKASFSVAERSAEKGARKREFDANELLAFTQIFEKPIGYFFELPPEIRQVTCGEPADVSRTASRKAVERVAKPSVDLVLSEYVANLRGVADALERDAREERKDG